MSVQPNLRPSHFLKHIELRIISNDVCSDVHSEQWRKYVYNSTICTLGSYGKGPSRGDSGGPLTLNNQLIGILSWGDPSSLEKPQQFSRISSYNDWIEEVTGVKAV